MTTDGPRQQRLAAQLRANLKRRKDQARAGEALPPGPRPAITEPD